MTALTGHLVHAITHIVLHQSSDNSPLPWRWYYFIVKVFVSDDASIFQLDQHEHFQFCRTQLREESRASWFAFRMNRSPLEMIRDYAGTTESALCRFPTASFGESATETVTSG